MAKERHKIIPAVYLVLIRDEKVLLLRRFNTGWQDGNYSMISGHLDGEESLTSAMVREAKEEAGIDIRHEDLQLIHVLNRPSEYERIDFFFTVKKWNGEIKNMEPEKSDDIRWFQLDKLPENIAPEVRHAIENIKKKIQYSELGW